MKFEDGKEFEPTGNAFQVQGAFANARTLAAPVNRLRAFGERCQVDDLKKALCLELELGFSSGVVCRRAMTKIVVLSVAHEIRQSKRKRNCPESFVYRCRQSTLPCLHFKRPRSTFTASRRAFQVKPALPPSLPVPRLSLTLQDRGWVKEDEDIEVSRGTSKPSAWLRCLFSLRVLPSPRSEVRLLRVHAATKDGRCVGCMRVPQQHWSLSAVNLHPPCRVSFSAEVAAAFTDAFFALRLCLTSRISSQQFNAHIP